MLGTRCPACGDTRTGALVRCAACGAAALETATLATHGRVVGATRVHAGSPRPVPFDLVLVETDDDLRVVGFATEQIAVGTRVAIVAETDGVPTFGAA